MPLLIAAAALTVKLILQRTSLDLLDSVPIGVTVQNGGAAATTARFEQPTEYRLDLTTDDGTVLWSSPSTAPAASVFPVHARVFSPGATTMAVYVWNGLMTGGFCPPKGSYVLRVRLLTQGTQPESSVRVRFIAPLSPSSISALRLGEAYTISGNLDPGGATIFDERGAANLTRRLVGAPLVVPLVVRGFIALAPDGKRAFAVERWAELRLVPQPAAVSSP